MGSLAHRSSAFVISSVSVAGVVRCHAYFPGSRHASTMRSSHPEYATATACRDVSPSRYAFCDAGHSVTRGLVALAASLHLASGVDSVGAAISGALGGAAPPNGLHAAEATAASAARPHERRFPHPSDGTRECTAVEMRFPHSLSCVRPIDFA